MSFQLTFWRAKFFLTPLLIGEGWWLVGMLQLKGCYTAPPLLWSSFGPLTDGLYRSVFKIVYECVLCPNNNPELANNKVRKGLLLFGMSIEGHRIQNLCESPVCCQLQCVPDFESSNWRNECLFYPSVAQNVLKFFCNPNCTKKAWISLIVLAVWKKECWF